MAGPTAQQPEAATQAWRTARWAGLGLIGALGLAGCVPEPAPDRGGGGGSLLPADVRPVNPGDPASERPPVIHLTIYHLSAPVGQVSRNTELWRPVNEQILSVATYDLLYRNGIRVGRVEGQQVPEMMAALGADARQIRPVVHVAPGAAAFELMMKEQIDEQLIYELDTANAATMRSYERGDNLLSVEFRASARHVGQVRISICPMVRAYRQRLTATGEGDSPGFAFVRPEKLFDLNLATELNAEQVLVIGPSSDAAPMSVGHAFFVREAPAERLEDLLLIVPQILTPARRDR